MKISMSLNVDRPEMYSGYLLRPMLKSCEQLMQDGDFIRVAHFHVLNSFEQLILCPTYSSCNDGFVGGMDIWEDQCGGLFGDGNTCKGPC